MNRYAVQNVDRGAFYNGREPKTVPSFDMLFAERGDYVNHPTSGIQTGRKEVAERWAEVLTKLTGETCVVVTIPPTVREAVEVADYELADDLMEASGR